MMPSIDMGAIHSTHKFKLCTRCDTSKPPEGGIDMGHKWICQTCWNRKVTVSNLKQNRTNRTIK